MNAFEPKRIGYKHHQKKNRHLRGENTKSLTLFKGQLGCQIQSSLIINSKQKESLRLLLLRLVKKFKLNKVKIFWRFATNIPETKKSINSRMGSGVGAFEYHQAKIKSNSIVFELENLDVNSKIFPSLLDILKRQVGAWFSPKLNWIYNKAGTNQNIKKSPELTIKNNSDQNINNNNE